MSARISVYCKRCMPLLCFCCCFCFCFVLYFFHCFLPHAHELFKKFLNLSLRFYHSPSANTRGTSRMFGKLPKSPNLVLSQASLRRGDEGPDEDRRTNGSTMWLSAILFSFFLTLTFCEEKKDTDKGPIVRARLEVC